MGQPYQNSRNGGWGEEDDDKGRSTRVDSLMVFADGEQEEEGVSFVALYASLMILLMTFFIVIYSYSEPSRPKFEMAQESLERIFDTLGVVETKEIISFLKSKMSFSKQKGDDSRQVSISLEDVKHDLEDKFSGCEVDINMNETTILIQDGKIFSGDKLDYEEHADNILNAIADYINKDKYLYVFINSHYAQEKGIEGEEDHELQSWLISSSRAVMLAKHFADKGVDNVRISAIGFGDKRPAFDEYGNALKNVLKNSRIEVVIRKDRLDF